MIALIDTGSPVSFVKSTVYKKYIELFSQKITLSKRNLKNLSNLLLNILGVIRPILSLKSLENFIFVINLNIPEENIVKSNLILGRDFLDKEKPYLNL